VSRAWTLAFGIMSQQEFAPEVPEPYREAYGVTALRDPEELQIEDSVRNDTKIFAEASVQATHKLIFPAHGIRMA
jgi:hypothetical protein